MSSLASNPTSTDPTSMLQFNLNDSTLDLLNAAIASHHTNTELVDNSKLIELKENSPCLEKNERTSSISSNESNTNVSNIHTKRELDKDDQTTASTAPKRAGRKPLDKTQSTDAPLDPKQKRKAQNRAAQRAFRDRKEKHVAELQARIAELEALNASKNEDLVKENEQLKEMLKKLQEENYALKGAQFTFEFPVNDSFSTTPNSAVTPITDMHQKSFDGTYQTTSGSSMSSSNSYSGEDIGSSNEHSPLTNSHSHEDDSTSTDTPVTTTFSSEPLQFGLISQPQQQQQPQQPQQQQFSQALPTNSLDFLAVGDNNNLFTDINTINAFPTGDLFHGKDDLFANLGVPASNTANDDFLFANEDLTGLFGNTDDLFGLNNTQLNMAAQFGLSSETPACRRLNLSPAEKKQMIKEKLQASLREGKYVHEVHQELQRNCPDFNLDALCDELKRKAVCTQSQFPMTDHDVDAFVKCLDRV